VQPFSIAPWAGRKLPMGTPRVLAALRGDFFCCPFGIDRGRPYRGQATPPHGETANSDWRLESIERSQGRSRLVASLAPEFRRGRITKEIVICDGQTAVYQRHRIQGLSGPITLGHHPMLRFPTEGAVGLISTSGFARGLVFPTELGSPSEGCYSALRPGAEFTRLNRVPLARGGFTDLSEFPSRRGYDDLVQLLSRRQAPFAWTAVVFPKERYVWFSLKDPRVLTSTLLWISNGGRYAEPWKGQHAPVMGLEEVTGYFDFGVASSHRKNPVSARGHPTALRLREDKPLTVSFIMAVAAVPTDFGKVVSITPTCGGVVVKGSSRRLIKVPLNLEHLGV